MCTAVTSYVFLVSWLDGTVDERWSELIMLMLYYRMFRNSSNTAETVQKKLVEISSKNLMELTGNLLEIIQLDL